MPSKSLRHLGLVPAVLRCLPLADITDVDMLALHGDERDPAELEPRACLCLHHLRVLAARADAGGSIAFLFDLGRAAEDDRDEEAEVLRRRNGGRENELARSVEADTACKGDAYHLAGFASVLYALKERLETEAQES